MPGPCVPAKAVKLTVLCTKKPNAKVQKKICKANKGRIKMDISSAMRLWTAAAWTGWVVVGQTES